MESKSLLSSESNTLKPVYEIVEVETDNGSIQKGIYVHGVFYRMLHAWYSHEASSMNHLHIYLNQYDKAVTVTTVSTQKDDPTAYKDSCYRGLVFKHISSFKIKN